MKYVSFIDGEIMKEGEGCIPVDDLGLQRGYAVFDYARVFHGKVFHFDDHIERFRKSAAGLNLDLSYTDERLFEIVIDLIRKIEVESPGIRFILTGGSAYAPELLEKSRLVIIAEELPGYPSHIYEKGVKLATYEFQRDLPHVKTTNYMNAFRLERFRREKNVFSILYHWRGKILECPRDNFFVFRGDNLVTPKEDILHGITRKVVIELAQGHFNAEERQLNMEELRLADEAFITSTTKGLVPVVKIDDMPVRDGAVGRRTRKLMELFNKYIENY